MGILDVKSIRNVFAGAGLAALGACTTVPDTSYQQSGSTYSRGNVDLPTNCSVSTRQPLDVRPDGTAIAGQGRGSINCVGDSNSQRRDETLEGQLRRGVDAADAAGDLLREGRQAVGELNRLIRSFD